MNTHTVPTLSLSDELGALIAESEALDARWADLEHELDRQIAWLERMNPVQIQAMYPSGPLVPATTPAGDDEEPF